MNRRSLFKSFLSTAAAITAASAMECLGLETPKFQRTGEFMEWEGEMRELVWMIPVYKDVTVIHGRLGNSLTETP